MPTFKKATINTPARLHLATLIESRAEAAAEATAATARIERLAALSSDPSPIRAKLAALDAEEAALFASWAKDPDAPVPAADTATRAALHRELSEAVARSDAAARAADGVRAEVAEANRRVALAEHEISVAAATIALEEMAPIADSARVAMTTIAESRMKGQALARILGEYSGPTSPGFAAEYVAAGEALKNSFDLPRVSEDAERAFMANVSRFLAALRVDAGAALEAA